MSDNNLKFLLEYLLEDGIFGKSFDDPNKKRPKFKPPEKNTPEEEKFIDDLSTWYNSHLDASDLKTFASTIKKLIPQINSGMYPELKPDPGVVYRGMTMKIPDFLKYFKIKSIKVVPQKPTEINKSGVLKPVPLEGYPAGKEVTSWSTNPEEASLFSRLDTNEVKEQENYLNVLFYARIDDPGNKFIINPSKMKNTYEEPLTGFEEEDEVLAVGPVKYFKILVMSMVPIGYEDVENSDENVTRFENEYVNTAIKRIMNSQTIISNYATLRNQFNNRQNTAGGLMGLAHEIDDILENIFFQELKPPSMLNLGLNPFQTSRVLQRHIFKSRRMTNVFSKKELLNAFLEDLLFAEGTLWFGVKEKSVVAAFGQHYNPQKYKE